MATHSSILAWRIPWTEEPGGLQSTGSQSRTRLSDFTFTFTSLSLCSYQCIIIEIFYLCHFWKVEKMITRCNLNFHFAYREWIWASLHMLRGAHVFNKFSINETQDKKLCKNRIIAQLNDVNKYLFSLSIFPIQITQFYRSEQGIICKRSWVAGRLCLGSSQHQLY